MQLEYGVLESVLMCKTNYNINVFFFTDGYKGLWYRKKHKKVREECFSLVAKHFNGIPFEYSALKSTHVFPEEGTINFL